MNHLSRDERLLALDGALGDTRQAHLAACRACRTDVESLRRVLARVRALDVPEPSPLMWDYLAARVGEAIAREPRPVPAESGWWSPRRVAAAVAVVAAAATTGVLTRPTPTPSPAPVAAARDVDVFMHGRPDRRSQLMVVVERIGLGGAGSARGVEACSTRLAPQERWFGAADDPFALRHVDLVTGRRPR
jgi:hypothetical protein